MDDGWKESAVIIGKTISILAGTHPELEPLASSFRNFARKYRLEGDGEAAAIQLRSAVMGVDLKRVRVALTAFEQVGLVVIDKSDSGKLVKTVDRQSEEINALELRVKRLIDELRHLDTGCRFKCKPCH